MNITTGNVVNVVSRNDFKWFVVYVKNGACVIINKRGLIVDNVPLNECVLSECSTTKEHNLLSVVGNTYLSTIKIN